MSSFAGLNIAYTGLNAARAALEVTGQNVANANTEGYTRQRVDQSAMTQTVVATHMGQSGFGDGVDVTGVSRLNDAVVDARVRSTASAGAYWSTTASALGAVEDSLNEPSTSGLSGVLNTFWSSWQAMATNTGSAGQANTLIAQGRLVATTLAAGYTAATDAWSAARTAAATTVGTINATAANIASLNDSIRAVAAAGGNVNGLLDQRDVAVTALARLTGATTRSNPDGTIDVVVGGNAIVSGVTSRAVRLDGAQDFSGVSADPVRLVWSGSQPASAVSLDGGEMAARIAALQPAATGAGTAAGTGGVYAEAAKAYDDVARLVADAVNALHETGQTSSGAAGGKFFDYSATGSVATSLTVLPTSIAGIAAAGVDKGRLDNTIADRISQIGSAVDSPDSAWATYVSRIGSQSATAAARASSATTAAAAAKNAQTSVGGVDLDEETANLVVFQHAYQASARVISTINDVLDSLLNMGAR